MPRGQGDKDNEKDKDKPRGKGKGGGGRKKPGKNVRRLAKGLLGKPPGELRPTGKGELTSQAQKTMAAIYAPAYADLQAQERTLKSVDAKRARDNKYYLDWLGSQSEQLQAHSRAADNRIQETQKEIADTANVAVKGMRGQLIKQAGEHSQVVSNAKQASAFETSPEAKRSGEMLAEERRRTTSAVESAEKTRQVNQASNFAQTAAAEARRVADLWTGLKDVASAKQGVKLEQAAETAKEVARLLDREIEKAQSRAELEITGIELALQKQGLGLEKKGLGIEKKRLKLDKWIAKQQMAHESSESAKDRRLERKLAQKERKHEQKENAKDREAEQQGGDGEGQGKKKARAARKSAAQLVNQLGVAKAKQNKAQVIDKVMSQTDVGYNQALKAVNQAIHNAAKSGGGGGTTSPNAELND